MAIGTRPPAWFWLVAIMLLAWNAMGVWACIQQLHFGAESWGPHTTDYDRRLYAALPAWYNYVYIVATFGGLLGALALLLKEKRARWLFWLSFVAVIVMFGYVFGATDLIQAKGKRAAIAFPAIVAGVAAFSIWFAQYATRRGWIGRR
ncbi:MAG: hypothetical protein J0I47_02175 [Sphingomonas sp.]|uniref:hypothetical protein n=1 Tax=Sphingomonas sp. TaxID=28214 RepID=UPI001AC01C2E|nr:hypothetical protein [Sphingomonas sp.]MBN8807036.1 hypothetical protein [Sphingomonas sp.]